MVDLEALEVRGERLQAREHGRHDHQRAQLCWHAVAQLERGQDLGAEAARDACVRQRHRRLDCDDDPAGCEGAERPRTAACPGQRNQWPCEDDRRQQRDTCDVAADPHRGADPDWPGPHRGAVLDFRFERPATACDQQVARIALARRVATARGPHRAARNLDLCVFRATCEFLNRLPVAVARREVHLPEAGVRPQDRIDEADAFEQVCPVDGGDRTHARDHVADGDARRALALVLVANDRVGGRAGRRQAAFQPCECGRHLRVLVTQPLQQLDGERRRQRLVVPFPQHGRQRFRQRCVDAEQPVGQPVGLLPYSPSARDQFRRAPQVLHQHDAQRDGNGPQLADGQRLHALVGRDESRQQVRVEAAVRMRDECPCQPENAWIPGQGPVRELGQLPVVAGRQVVIDLADLRLDDMVVVDQPFGGRRDCATLAYRPGNRTMGVEQCAAIVVQARSQRPDGAGPCRDALCGREAFSVLFEPLGTEDFAAYQLDGLGSGDARRIGKAAQDGHHQRAALPCVPDSNAMPCTLESAR